jgi:succinyl-diaminopimelate desuccinylase
LVTATKPIAMDVPRALTELLMELLAIPSVIGEERAIADFVEARLRRRLRDVRRVGNAVVGLGPRQGRPRLGLVGHLDTVAAAPGDVNAPRIDAGRVHGLGSSDMKSAIACDLSLLEDMDLDKCPFDLTWVYYDKEEGPIADNGLRALFVAVPEILGLDLAVCGEPTDNAVQLGCVGSLHARVTFRGKAAHSARPWQG